jgi:hypothetical protein
MNVIMLVPLAGLLVLVNAPIWWNWNLALTLMAFAGVMMIAVFLMKIFKLLDSPKF